MIEVFNTNLSFQILDFYIHKTKKLLTDLELHLIGLTNIRIASQLENLFPIQMN